MINALGHPERDTVLRAVNILGKLKSIKAVNPLLALFQQTDNPFLKIEILHTLSEIGVPEAKTFIMGVSESAIGIVKRKAEELINRY